MSALVTIAKALGGFAGRDGGQVEAAAIAVTLLLIGVIAVVLASYGMRRAEPRSARRRPPRSREAKPAQLGSSI